MARKKKEEGGIKSEWINTFADLMNLLLCFFVLLFAMSSTDNEKFEQLSISMANSIGVLDGGGSAIDNEQLISSGMSQLNELDVFFNNMGKSVEGNEDNTTKNNTNDTSSDGVMDNTQGTEGIQNSGENEGINQGKDNNSGQDIDQALEKIEEEMQEVTTGMYDDVSDLTEQYSLGDEVELSIDPDYRFVQLNLNGSILYNSGDANIKETAKPILTKIGDVLKKFKGYSIEIVGHTDNVPITNSSYKDNNWLSSARALNAAEFLIIECDIDPAKLKYSGRGEYEPISSNTTEDGRAKNRRIEIKIYNKYSGK